MDAQTQLIEYERRNSVLERLLNVSLILNSNLALTPLLDFIMEATCEITGSEAASILLYDRNTDELHFVASNSPGTDISQMAKIPVPMEGSIAGQIVRENRSIVVQNATEDPRIYRTVDKSIGFQTRSLLGVPMQIKDDVIGVLESLNKLDEQWTEHDHSHLSILASQAAVAIENARQSEALQRAYAELNKLDKLKNDFIAIASHELRTPLGVILGYASFLKEESQGEANDYATSVLNSALHLRNLIEDMTNLRYLQLGRADLTFESVRVSTLLTAAKNDVQALAEAHGHRLIIDLSGGDALVQVDRTKIGMALSNILNNAIKFTSTGGQIKMATRQHSPREVWITIADNGIGIPGDQLESIFQEFHQVADHMTRQHNGMGLGLSIAQGIVVSHNGRIWAESPGPKQGSTFYIALPVVQQ